MAAKIEPSKMDLYICSHDGLFEHSGERLGEASTYFQSARRGELVKFD
jgi:hypothetical protein